MTWFLWILQVLILSAGVYVFLRFVATTRGNRLVRGLIVSTIVVAVGLFGLTQWLELEELGHILQGVSGFLVILLAVLFQPELRRGIAELGEGSFVGRMIRRLSRDSINEIVQAVQSMASRRTGALIAIECESNLDAYIEGGVRVDATVHRLLLESIFHPGATLHDGAVVIRKDRIAAAACLFPLTENIRIARSTGTRHRAALGLTDETDAVTIVVSEETGRVSVARNGQLEGVPPNRLDQVLRKSMGGEEKPEEQQAARRSSFARWPATAWSFLRDEWLWLAASLLLGSAVFYTAHGELEDVEFFPLRVVTASVDDAHAAVSRPGELLVVLPSGDYHVTSLPVEGSLNVRATGTRAQISRLGQQISGLIELGDVQEGRIEIPLDSVRWHDSVYGIEYGWADRRAPSMEIVRFDRRRVVFGPEALVVDDTNQDRHFAVHVEDSTFDPPSAEIEGPAEVIQELGVAFQLTLEPIELAARQDRDWRGSLGLAQALLDRDLAFTGLDRIAVTLPLRPAQRQLGVITREVPLICTDVARAAELERWSIPSHAQTARFSVHISGLIPAEAARDAPVVLQRTRTIQRFVDENLVVYADVAEMPPAGEGRSVRVRHTLREDWRTGLDFFNGSVGEGEDLWIELESGEEILLEERKQIGPPASGTGGEEGT